MSRSSYLFAGIFGSFAVSCLALVVIPQLQIGGLTAQVDEENNDVYPVKNARQGRDIYIREGCYYCHSQQVRDEQNGTDIERGWGTQSPPPCELKSMLIAGLRSCARSTGGATVPA